MTREEAKKIRIDTVIEYSSNSIVYNIDEVNKRIDEIYDFFEKKFKQSDKCEFTNNNENENINNLFDHGLISDKYYLQYIIKKYGIKI